tara:strand:- start:108 stop:470 length:363 start_codon:yes stop_codon:yes gene_type:complete
MDDAKRRPLFITEVVGVVERIGDLGAQLKDEIKGQGNPGTLGLIYQTAEIPAANVFHDEKKGAGIFAEIFDPNDVRVLESGSESGLILKGPNELFIIGKMGVNSFEDRSSNKVTGADLLC